MIKEIIELQYLGDENHIFLFKCHQFDPKSIQNDTIYDIVNIRHKFKLNIYDPFILSVQAQQVYYTKYPSSRNKERNDWWTVCKVKISIFPEYELESDVNTEFFQSDLFDDVELSASSDESVEPLSLSKENEVKVVDPQQNKMQLGDSDEEEPTSDQDESDIEDANAEFDISSASEDEIENI